MDITKFMILSIACIGGFMVTSYQGIAHKKGWPVGKAFDISKAGWIAVLGFMCQWGSVIISFFVNPWWSAFIVLIVGFIGYMTLVSIFKKHSQILATIIIFLSYFLIPFYIFSNTTDISHIEHFIKSIDYSNHGTRLLNQGESFVLIDDTIMNKVISFKKDALKEAVQIDIEKLNEVLNGFGDHYKKEFISGLELFIDGYENNDAEKIIMGQVLLEKWGNWYDDNIDKIKNSR
ncbi:MAG: hypothetical protein AB7W47_02800 [Calditrichaceae bacterium]